MKKIIFHQHAIERMEERGISDDEIIVTIKEGEQFPVKFNRIGFRRNFPYNKKWRGKYYTIKQVETIVVDEKDNLLVITAISRYY